MRKALFLHIQKTAGTSIQAMARAAYGNDAVCSHADFLSLGQSGCAALPFVSGHFGFEFAQPLMEDRFSFTFLRDPIDRLISHFVFCRSQPPNNFLNRAAKEKGLSEFLALADEWPHRHALWNNIVWQLSYGYNHPSTDVRQRKIMDYHPETLLELACTNLATFDHVGFVDSFDHDASLIFSRLGAPEIAPLRYNERPDGMDFLELRQSAENQLLEMTELDRTLYETAKNNAQN